MSGRDTQSRESGSGHSRPLVETRGALAVASSSALVVLVVGVAFFALHNLGSQSSSPSAGTSVTTSPSGSPAPSSEPTAAAALSPEDIASLREVGYFISDPGDFSPESLISAQSALYSAHAFVSADHKGEVTLERVSSPDLGTLEDKSDPQSKVSPLFDDDLVWLVVFHGQMPKNGAGGLSTELTDDETDATVAATAVVLVDAISGEAVRAVVF